MMSMSDIKPSKEAFSELIRESEDLEERMAYWQAESFDPDPAVIAAVRSQYRSWHSRARRFLDSDAQKVFDGCRDGVGFSPGVSRYLENPREPSVFRGGDDSPAFMRWQLPFTQVREKLERQRTLLAEASPDTEPAEAMAIKLGEFLRRLPLFLATLQRRAPDWPIGNNIKNEADLQIVVEAYLRTLFDDVRAENYVPSHAGANSRVDFLLPQEGIAVETKMTRNGLTERKLGEELLIDAARYPNDPSCKALVAFVYDPERRISNPRGVEWDLTKRASTGVPFVCIIAS